MRKLVAGAAFACVLSALPCWAQEAATADSPENAARRAEQAASEAQYWANEAAQAAHQDPRAVSRRRAAFKQANRIERLEARKWTGRSASRPVTFVGAVGWSYPFAPVSAHLGPWHDHHWHGAGVWGGSILDHHSFGYVESSRAPALGLFGGWGPAVYRTSR